MTKAELYELINSYLETDETSFNENRDVFVQLAEEDILKQVQLPEMRKNATSSFTADAPYLQTPDDFLSTYSMAVIVSGQHQYLVSKDVNFLREVYPDATDSGVPRFFSQFDHDTFIVAPTPDQNYGVELHYMYIPESLSALGDDGETWLSINAQNAILFGTLMHGYIYLKGDQDVIAHYKEQFQKAVADLKVIAEGRNRKDSYRLSDKRLPV